MLVFVANFMNLTISNHPLCDRFGVDSINCYYFVQDIISISVRRGGIDACQPFNQWLSTISQSPNVISMSFVPITSLLNSVPGNGFLSHAVNLYLRCKYTKFRVMLLFGLLDDLIY